MMFPASRLLPAPGVAQDPVARALAYKGFTVKQLLTFYVAKGIGTETTTEEVVRDIVIPETAEDDAQTYYMDSPFMRDRGGPQKADKLVSHAWKSCFITTVLNTLVDAADLSVDALQAQLQEATLGARFFTAALGSLDEGILGKTYWLCIFAVNEHRSICGDCWTCRPQTSERLRRRACDWLGGCGEPKFNPCDCGALKHQPGDDAYEIDKFDQVVRLMPGGLVVSLDPALGALTRIWVVAEIVEASTSQRVAFRAAHGLSAENQGRLLRGAEVVPRVEQCEASSENDLAMIMSRIPDKDEFNDFVRTYVEVSFGKCSRLVRLGEGPRACFRRLDSLVIDCSWNRGLRSTADLNLGEHFGVFQFLRNLDMSLQDLAQLADVASLTRGLCELTGLQKLRLDCSRCASLRYVSGLRQGLAGLQALEQLDLDFSYCWALNDINGLRQGLAGLRALEQLKLNLSDCVALVETSGLHHGRAELRALQHLQLVLSRCEALEDISELRWGFLGLHALQQLTLEISECAAVADVSWLGQGLAQLRVLRELKLVFSHCDALGDISGLGIGLIRLRAREQPLEQLDMDFSCCKALPDVLCLRDGLVGLRAVQRFKLDLLQNMLLPTDLRKCWQSRSAFVEALGPTSLGRTAEALAFYRKNGACLGEASDDDRADREVVMAAISHYGPALASASNALRADGEVVRVALGAEHEAWRALDCASEDLRADPELQRKALLAFFRENGKCLEEATDDLRADREVVLAAVSHHGPALAFASEALRADGEVVRVALGAKYEAWRALQFASDALRADREIVKFALANNYKALGYAREELRADPEMANLSARRALLAYRGATGPRAGREVVPAAVGVRAIRSMIGAPEIRGDLWQTLLASYKADGGQLEHASDDLRADREVVLAAVGQDGQALQFASEALRADREVVRLAVAESGRALQFASEALRADADVVRAALGAKRNGARALEYASEELRADPEMVTLSRRKALLEYYGADGSQLEHASEDLRADREVVLAAVGENGRALQFASEALRADGEVVRAALLAHYRAAQRGEAEQHPFDAVEVLDVLD